MQILQHSKKINDSVIPVKTPKRAQKTVQLVRIWGQVKKPAVVGCTSNTSAGEAETGQSQGLASYPVSQPSLTAKSWVMRDPVAKTRADMPEEQHPKLTSDLLTHLHMGACVPNTHTYTYTSKEKN